MSTYTTGEIAKLCEVTVRTVQYYDNRGILIPSDFSEGGRRLYSEEDVQKLKLICFLRDMGLQLERIATLQKELHKSENISVKKLSDIAFFMEREKKLKKVRGITIAVGLVMDAIEIGTICIGITRGNWIPFAIGMLAVIACGILLVRYYYRHVLYICPECHKKFRPKFWEFFWSRHTPRTRKLTCSGCHYKGFVVETYGEEEE